jgi:hypothetical protein
MSKAPVDDLVAGALRRGRRSVRRRRLGVGVVAAAAVAVLVLLLTGGAAGTDLLLPHRMPAGAGVPSASVRPTLPTTAAAILFRLGQLLPGVQLSQAHRFADESAAVTVYLDRGQGPGMVHVAIGEGGLPTTDQCQSSDGMAVSCTPLAGGATAVITTNSSNCVQSLSVEVHRRDRVIVGVYVATCLMFDGTTNPPGRAGLTQAQAVAIAADPQWGSTMDADLVTDAASRFPSLPVSPS